MTVLIFPQLVNKKFEHLERYLGLERTKQVMYTAEVKGLASWLRRRIEKMAWWSFPSSLAPE